MHVCTPHYKLRTTHIHITISHHHTTSWILPKYFLFHFFCYNNIVRWLCFLHRIHPKITLTAVVIWMVVACSSVIATGAGKCSPHYHHHHNTIIIWKTTCYIPLLPHCDCFLFLFSGFTSHSKSVKGEVCCTRFLFFHLPPFLGPHSPQSSRQKVSGKGTLSFIAPCEFYYHPASLIHTHMPHLNFKHHSHKTHNTNNS